MDPPSVMISYQWDAQDRMLKLKDALSRAGYAVWMDVEKMEGNLDDRMSEGVEKAIVILVCFSERYQASTSCKKEAQYAAHLNKTIIPLKYEEFQPSGWLGLMINALLYYDVQTDESMMTNLPKIIQTIKNQVQSPCHEDLPIGTNPPRGIGTSSFNIKVCQRELLTFYEQEMGTVQLLPWGHDVVAMDAIFVNLTLSVDEKLPVGTDGMAITAPEEILSLKSRNGQKVNRVLVKGFAGSGKSTAMAKLAYDWAKYLHSKDSVFSQYELLFVLNLSEIDINETLIDAIFDQILPQDTENTKQGLQAYFQSHGKDILILLDGLDEFPMKQLQKKVTGDIESLLANRKMRDTCVVVTTRPHKVEDLGEHQKHYAHVKLSGFSENNIEVYIEKFFQENKKAAKGLIDILQQSPSIKTLAEIPVMLLMLCLLWSDAEKLPDTATALYEQAVLYLWKRYQNSCDVISKDDDVLEVLLTLGKVALDGIISGGNLVFSEKDFPEQTLKEACKAGLLTKERLRSKLNISNSVSFLHKSVQEYCAAYYWVTLAEKANDSFQSYLKDIADDDHVFAEVELLTFCCGMSKKAAAFVLPHVVQAFRHRTEDSLCIGGITNTARKNIWPLFRMLRESKFSYGAVHSWFEPLFQSKVVEIRQNPPSSLAYFHHLVRIVSKSKLHSSLSEVRELKLFCGSGSFDLIVQTLDEMPHVESLVLSWETEAIETRPSETQVSALSERISKLTNLINISILARYKLNISRIIASLFRGSRCSVSIRKIELGNVEFDTESMGNVLKRQTSLKSLLFTNVTLTPQGAAQMLSQIRSSVQNIHIVGSQIGEAVHHLKPIMPSLEELVMTDTKLQEEDVLVLAGLLPRAGILNHLDLSWNNIGSSMVTLARQLQHCPQLHTLTLLNTNIRQSGVIALTESFKSMPRLKHLMLSLGRSNMSDDNGFEILEAIFRSLHYLPKLEIMDLKRLPAPEGSNASDMVFSCLSGLSFNFDRLARHLASQQTPEFGLLCRPSMLQKLNAEIARYTEQEKAHIRDTSS